jgi:hypothetical protein
LPALVAAIGVVATSSAAHAFTIYSVITPGCHEGITSAALRAVRQDLVAAAPLASMGDDGPLIDDLPFTMDDDMKDIGAASLLIGIRDNDLKGRSAESIDQLVEVHGNPDNQREHCLRTPAEDEPGGSGASIDDCRGFIRERLTAAIDGGLDASGVPDTTRREDVTVYLSFAGKTSVSIPTFYVEMGRAMHTVQDSFAHDWRTADGTQVTVSLNWVEFAEGTFDESRDGPEHRTPLDTCDDQDDLRTQRHALAIQASSELLRAALNPALDRNSKLAAVDAVLDKYLTYKPGCTHDNNWCDAPERQYVNGQGCGCTLVGERSGAAAAVLMVAALTLLGVRRGARSHVA